MVDRLSNKFIGAVQDEWELYSDNPQDYVLGQPIGYGSSSTVYQAVYQPRSTSQSFVPCALKVLDLDRLPPNSLRLLQRETTLMSLSKHPNVLRVRGTWVEDSKLFISMRLMNKGSAADVMRFGWQGGMDEEVVRCILKQALQGLNYLHINGFIHRDVKAANLLIDDDGTVLLGDLGVATSLDDNTHHGTSVRTNTLSCPRRPSLGKRISFVGTPCWMSPELIQGHQYDSASDIWSFGITALELAQGRPPRSRDKRAMVLLKVVRDPPPELDRVGGIFKYSHTFKEIVESCLAKDPSKRPSAEQLLQLPFFKGAKKKSYLVGAILQDLPPLTARQEHRGVPSHGPPHAHSTIDSWDFSLSHAGRTVPHGHPLPTLPLSEEQVDVDMEGSGQEDSSMASTMLDKDDERGEDRVKAVDPPPSTVHLVPGPHWGMGRSEHLSPARDLTPSTSPSEVSSESVVRSAAIVPPPPTSLWRKLVGPYSMGEKGGGSKTDTNRTLKARRKKSTGGKAKISHLFLRDA